MSIVGKLRPSQTRKWAVSERVWKRGESGRGVKLHTVRLLSLRAVMLVMVEKEGKN
jgi:hypothetical protein